MLQLTRINFPVNRIKRRLLSHVWLARTLIVSLFVVLVLSLGVFVKNYWSFAAVLFSPTENNLSNSHGRTNILLLGVGGPGHEGPDLTDTMILASVNLVSGQVTLISIPRDLWVPSLRAKINTAYHYGQKQQPPDGGFILAKSAVSEMTGQSIQYAAVLDFSEFIRFIDSIDGIEVDVTNSFTDSKYPIPGKENDSCNGDPQTLCRYETITFTAGNMHMDGNLALKYVRSRQSVSESEGTDFARSRRQSQVIKAIESKLIAKSKSISGFRAVLDSLQGLAASVITDLPKENPLIYARLANRMRNTSINSISLSEPSPLYHPPVSPQYDNQWVLMPIGNDPKSVSDYISPLLK